MPEPFLLQRLKENGPQRFPWLLFLCSGLAALALAYPTHRAQAQEQQGISKLTPEQAAERLDEILYGKNLAGDVFIADVNGNQTPDFVAIHRGGVGTVLPRSGKAEERFGGEERDRGIIGADFGFVVVSTASVMMSEIIEWEADVIFLVAFGNLIEVPVASLSECHRLQGQPKQWRICLMRAWVQGEKPDADLTFLGGLLSEPLPPHGYVQRYHDQEVSLPLLISTDGLAGNHFVTVSDLTP